MGYKWNNNINEYNIPPLEGFWWQDGIKGMDYNQKEKLNFISILKLPDFITKENFDLAKEVAAKKNSRFFKSGIFNLWRGFMCLMHA